MAKRFLPRLESNTSLATKRDSCVELVSGVFNRFLSQQPRDGETGKLGGGLIEEKDRGPSHAGARVEVTPAYDGKLSRDVSHDGDGNGWKWKLEDTWLSKAIEPAMQVFKWASAAESVDGHKVPPNTRSLAEIFTSLQKSKVGIQDWSLGDLTMALYLVYLRQASSGKVDDIHGVQISSDLLVQDLIYNIELAKGAYKSNAAGLARHSMLQERNILKFVKDSSVMRPGYFIGIDVRNKLVIFGIRGTHTVYDIVTDIITSSDSKEFMFEGFSTHFGTSEAARWFLHHELRNVKKCMEKHKGFGLRLVGHSLGGAAAALLAIMLRKKPAEELGFDPNAVSAVVFGSPPCLSKELAQSCASYVSTVIMQDDIIPRLSASSLRRLRNEIIQTDWINVLAREDLKSLVDWVENAKQAVSLVQDLAGKLSDYAKFKSGSSDSDISPTKQLSAPLTPKIESNAAALNNMDEATVEELFVPGTLYYLRKQIEDDKNRNDKPGEVYTLWKLPAGYHFQKIHLSGNLISDHKCDSHYYALRDVLKGLPVSDERSRFCLNCGNRHPIENSHPSV